MSEKKPTHKSSLHTKSLILQPNAEPEHFNPSLSKIEKGCFTAVIKWRLRLTLKFTMASGGQAFFNSADAIVVRRVDILKVHDYARAHCDLRDYLLIRLPMKIGLRTSEIATLRVELINFENRSFQVLDSKKHRLYPLPLDVLTLQLIRDLVEKRTQGYVFSDRESWKKREGKPLSRDTIWYHVNKAGEDAGVKRFNPRLLRHYFAADWAIVRHKSMETLRRILRHKHLGITHRYLARLVFFEDLQREYEETQQPYIVSNHTRPVLNGFYKEWCSKCENEPICKIIDQMCSSPGATGCRYYKPKEEIKKIVEK